jgi:hypothetical protein
MHQTEETGYNNFELRMYACPLAQLIGKPVTMQDVLSHSLNIIKLLFIRYAYLCQKLS